MDNKPQPDSNQIAALVAIADAIRNSNVDITVDANGWYVYRYGNFTQYKKRLTFTTAVTGAAGLGLSSYNLPVGVATIGACFIDYAFVISGNAYAFVCNFEGNTSSTGLNFTYSMNAIRAGYVDVTMTKM